MFDEFIDTLLACLKDYAEVKTMRRTSIFSIYWIAFLPWMGHVVACKRGSRHWVMSLDWIRHHDFIPTALWSNIWQRVGFATISIVSCAVTFGVISWRIDSIESSMHHKHKAFF